MLRNILIGFFSFIISLVFIGLLPISNFIKNQTASDAVIVVSSLMNSFRRFQFAEKLIFSALFLSFPPPIALLCDSKKPSTALKIFNFRLNSKRLNEFTISRYYLQNN